jgi:hypothetical protein
VFPIPSDWGQEDQTHSVLRRSVATRKRLLYNTLAEVRNWKKSWISRVALGKEILNNVATNILTDSSWMTTTMMKSTNQVA